MDVTFELVGFAAEGIEELGGRLDERGLSWRRHDAARLRSRGAEDADPRARLARGESVLVLGDGLSAEEAATLLAASLPAPRAATLPASAATAPRGAALVFAAGERPELFESFVAADALFYLSRAMPPPEQIAELLDARSRLAEPEVEDPGVQIGAQIEDLLHGLERHSESAMIAGRIAKELEVLLEASGAFVWFFDPAKDLLWRPADWTSKEEVRRESAAAGLVGYVARTGAAVAVACVGEDARFDAEADNDHGPDDQRLLAAAVSGDGRAGRCLGVLVALRPPDEPAFDERDRRRLEYVARRLRRLFERVTERHERESRQQVMSEQAAAIFRPEALEHYARGADFTGRALEISPTWMRHAVTVLVAAALAFVVFALVARVDESVGAPAVVELRGGEARVLGLLPARTRPLLDEGMSVRVELDGFGEIGRTTVASLSGVLSRDEARRRVDARFHDTLSIDAGGDARAFTLVEARLDAVSFVYEGRRLELHDGLPGRIELIVDSRTVFESLMPGGE